MSASVMSASVMSVSVIPSTSDGIELIIKDTCKLQMCILTQKIQQWPFVCRICV
jgi:hypothetical protein